MLLSRNSFIANMCVTFIKRKHSNGTKMNFVYLVTLGTQLGSIFASQMRKILHTQLNTAVGFSNEFTYRRKSID